MSLTPTTELEAVNTMLNTIGEAPVNTLINMTAIDAITALSILQNVSRAVQVEGWFFNTEYNYPMTLDINGQIPLPTNLLSIDSTDLSDAYELVQRGTRAYDRKNHTYTFSASVKCNIILLLAFDEIPEVARNYIALRASRILQDRLLGSDSLHAMNREDEYQALISLRLINSENADFNILTGNSSVTRILTR
tara:strand:- start:1395 stop:1973 length:579 start_codon:yes stop_codon:yes gene_type:complete